MDAAEHRALAAPFRPEHDHVQPPFVGSEVAERGQEHDHADEVRRGVGAVDALEGERLRGEPVGDGHDRAPVRNVGLEQAEDREHGRKPEDERRDPGELPLVGVDAVGSDAAGAEGHDSREQRRQNRVGAEARRQRRDEHPARDEHERDRKQGRGRDDQPLDVFERVEQEPDHEAYEHAERDVVEERRRHPGRVHPSAEEVPGEAPRPAPPRRRQELDHGQAGDQQQPDRGEKQQPPLSPVRRCERRKRGHTERVARGYNKSHPTTAAGWVTAVPARRRTPPSRRRRPEAPGRGRTPLTPGGRSGGS